MHSSNAVCVDMKESLENCRIQSLPGFSGNSISVDILRLDLLHPVVSGNKWFKLRYYLEEAQLLQKKRLASFGGAYSNHIAAAAFAAKQAGLEFTGFIRGDENSELNPTLLQAKSWGMNIQWVDRQSYRDKVTIMKKFDTPDIYWIPEGGYGKTGAKGAATILDLPGTDSYSHIICATGTGTMMAGLIKAAKEDQEVIGVSVLKNHVSLEREVRDLLEKSDDQKRFRFIHGYHFGGYAKHPKALIDFMKTVWDKWQIPTDIVYTSKLLFAVNDLIEKDHFPKESNLLVIHSGGLQGNRSLPLNTLPF